MRTGILAAVTSALRQYVKPLGSYSWFKKAMNKYWYPFVTRRWDQDDVVFLNWGYEEDPPMGLPLAPEDERNRYCIQLYHRTATQTDLSGKKVLEPSCGHGGGGAYLVKTLHPASYTGLDFNPDGVAFAKRRYDLPGLDFVHGDAESLPFPDESFDAVLNVEASHAYPHFDRFLSEMVAGAAAGRAFPLRRLPRIPRVRRVGRGTGRPAVADGVQARDQPRGAARAGQQLGPVPRTGRSAGCPCSCAPSASLFAGAPDTLMYKELQRGRLSYRMYHFIKD